MTDKVQSELKKKIESDFHKKLKELEAKLAVKHKELNQIEKSIQHESKKIYGSTLSTLKSKKAQLNTQILKLTKEIKHIKSDYIKKLKKL
ncbi:MAG: hypothetical protein ACFE96_08110 [Candidatus Hermodarchaeota archaeon]